MKYTKHNWNEGCIYKVKDVKTPYSGHFVCNRIAVAVPNMDGVKPFTNQPAPSFSRKYLLYETLDIKPHQVDDVVQKVLKELRQMGFTKIEEVNEYTARMIELRDRPIRYSE